MTCSIQSLHSCDLIAHVHILYVLIPPFSLFTSLCLFADHRGLKYNGLRTKNTEVAKPGLLWHYSRWGIILSARTLVWWSVSHRWLLDPQVYY